MPLFGKKKPFPPLVDGFFLPQGCTREGRTIVIHREYSQQWFDKYPDSREAIKQMLAFLKSQYPAISSFHVRK